MMSYLRESLDASGQLDDPAWQKYLKYKPTSIDSSDDDIRASFKEVKEPTWICNMCSANPKWFDRDCSVEEERYIKPHCSESYVI